MKLSDLIRPEGLLLDVAAKDKDKVLRLLAAKSAELWGLEEERVFDKLNAREDLGSTGVGGGIALPHSPIPGLEEPALLLARLKTPVDFHAVDDHKVDLVLMLLLPENNASQHLNILSSAARALRSEGFARELRNADAGRVHALLLEAATEACER
ncbi:PTS sugar transporter subunit IIA [Falsirhodobacter xinxiangensis]|uniref:PTS sugar transporter subunit IIA n=1 Tax=Falsirhodobacter xinxiangensis TaxID=2530049 RepID=UPI0010AB1E2E|nr:PTS sugar transporter subunit IIA [Rhodobacter xinxiangensis]